MTEHHEELSRGESSAGGLTKDEVAATQGLARLGYLDEVAGVCETRTVGGREEIRLSNPFEDDSDFRAFLHDAKDSLPPWILSFSSLSDFYSDYIELHGLINWLSESGKTTAFLSLYRRERERLTARKEKKKKD